jgi:GDP-4-dehydro-6-deoxy-D-mannose reductase
MRPSSTPILWGDASRLHDATGWQPTIPFEKTLLDVLDDCRRRVNPSSSQE